MHTAGDIGVAKLLDISISTEFAVLQKLRFDRSSEQAVLFDLRFSHSSDYGVYVFTGCNAVEFGESPMILRNISPPTSETNIKSSNNQQKQAEVKLSLPPASVGCFRTERRYNSEGSAQFSRNEKQTFW
jgi:hypothetical protein